MSFLAASRPGADMARRQIAFSILTAGVIVLVAAIILGVLS